MKNKVKSALKHYILEGEATERILQYSMDIVDVFGMEKQQDGSNEINLTKLPEAYENVNLMESDVQSSVEKCFSTISIENGFKY